jgi:coenzyme Q-binding protein COQ10
MHRYHDTQLSPYAPNQLYNLVLDIERYPEFLPWCRAARILERNETGILGELVISFKHITESYVSEVMFTPPEGEIAGRIDVKLVRGPFKHLENHWQFIPLPDGGTEIKLELSFQFRTRLLDSLIGLLFGKATAKMAEAFKKRANDLYGSKS